MPSDRLVVGSITLYPSRAVERGDGRARDAARARVGRLKQGQSEAIRYFATRTTQAHAAGRLHGVFVDDAVLVPVPGSSPKMPGQVMNTELLARALNERGIGSDVAEVVYRRSAVPRSSRASSRREGRPTRQVHEASMEYVDDYPLFFETDVVLIDDVVTSGTTMLAVAALIWRAYPDLRITCFAPARVDRVHIWQPDDEAFLPLIQTTRPTDDGYAHRG